MKTVQELREKVFNHEGLIHAPKRRPDLLNFLGGTHEERVHHLAEKIIPGDDTRHRDERHAIFDYIIDFWGKALLEVPYFREEYRGINLAKRPFMAPSVREHLDDAFGFVEQYRWDTYFHNLGFILVGGTDIAVDQLLNFVDIFEDYKRIPNAAVSGYLSHGQPPFESQAVMDLFTAGVSPDRLRPIMEMVEKDLLLEWWDRGRGKRYERQTKSITERFGLLTRYTNMHFHSLLAGCEDGKDHNWITVRYGADYLPVQLNSLVYGMVDNLIQYYDKIEKNPEKVVLYSEFRDKMRADFQKTFWVAEGKWQGFRNYSLLKGEEGPILYGDLAAEVFPLYAGLATQEQAEATKNNLEKYYKGDYGLTITSLDLREGGSMAVEPSGHWEYQWEYPNCWAPIMYIAVEGLKKYGFKTEALDYALRWVKRVEEQFVSMNGFAEKYAYKSEVAVEDGFYGNVKGFGWTIAVYLVFLKELAENKRLP